MTPAKMLLDARAEFDAGTIDEAAFAATVNDILEKVPGMVPDSVKIAAFNKIAATIASGYQIHELENGIQNIKSDLSDYIFEAALSAILGSDIFYFTNALYENG
jgi:hypothetical protein